MNHGETNQKRVIGDLLNVGLGNHLTGQVFDKVDYPIPSGAALFRILPIPELDFARHDILTVVDTLPPVFEYSRLLKTILDSPVPDVTKLLKERFPLSEISRHHLVGPPLLPKRDHLPQGGLIPEDHEHATPKGLVRSCFSIGSQGEKVIVRGDFLVFDFGEPLHSWHSLHRANEIVNRPHRLQHHDFLGNKIMGLCLEPRPSRLQRLL